MSACLLLNGCVEIFEPTTEFFENILVIEATLTDEVKNHEFLLSGTYEFEEFVPVTETGATVKVVDDSQIEYAFQEVTPGKYVSISAFGAQPGKSYQLFISTADGRKYASDPTQTPQSESIFDLKLERTLNEEGEDGMAIDVVYAPSTDQKYFRYEYEEMYKIVAPRYTFVKLRWVTPSDAIMVPKDNLEGRICYNSVNSKTIIFNSPSGTDSGESLEYPLRFIKSDSYILSHR